MGGDLQAIGAVQQLAAEVDGPALQRDRPAADPAGVEADVDVRQQALVHPVGRDLVIDDLPEHGLAVGLGHVLPRRLDRGVGGRGDPVTGVEGDARKGREEGQRVYIPGLSALRLRRTGPSAVSRRGTLLFLDVPRELISGMPQSFQERRGGLMTHRGPCGAERVRILPSPERVQPRDRTIHLVDPCP